MPDLFFLPALPLSSNQIIWFGVLLLAGALGGQLAERALFLPRITGYAAAGLALGPQGFGLIGKPLLGELQVFADISIGLILFELGHRIDLGWLRRSPRLAFTSLAECAFGTALIYFTLRHYFSVEPLHAAAAAAIGAATSPAVVMRITADLGAEGQITERTLLLAALNSSIAVLALTALIPWLHLEYRGGWVIILLHPLYLLAGSTLLGLAASAITLRLLRWLGKRGDVQTVLLIGLILATVGAAIALKLSVLLALLAYGALVRNLDRRRSLVAPDFGFTGQLFFVILFVLAGANLDLSAAWAGMAIGAAFVAVRFAGKAVGVMAFIPGSGLKARHGLLIALALTPMSGLAVIMLQDLQSLFPEFGRSLAAIVVPAVVLLEIAGPVLTQFALKRAGEARPAAARG
ncbi:MAG: cation:proton antiporter [Burkholderiales bacterium]